MVSRLVSRRSRPRLNAVAAVLVLAVAGGCGAAQAEVSNVFWLKANGDPTVKLSGAQEPSAPGVTMTSDVRGTVANHGRASGSAADYVLVVAQDGESPRRLYYRIGGRRRIPVRIGDVVKVRVLMRRHVEDDGLDVALLVWREASTATIGDDTVNEKEELIAAVAMMGLLEKQRVPQALRVLRTTDIAAYHESGTYKADCEEIRAHQYFRVTRPEWIVALEGASRSARLLGPGQRFQIDDGANRFEVALLDNRRTESSTCRSAPEPVWSWAAIRVPGAVSVERTGRTTSAADSAPTSGGAARDRTR